MNGITRRGFGLGVGALTAGGLLGARGAGADEDRLNIAVSGTLNRPSTAERGPDGFTSPAQAVAIERLGAWGTCAPPAACILASAGT